MLPEFRSGLALVLLTGLLSCGPEPQRAQTSPKPTPDAFASIEARSEAKALERKAAPRWEQLSVWPGSGTAGKVLQISKEAIQWRAEWSCKSGSLRLETDPPPRNSEPIAQSTCPATGVAYSVRKGPVRLSVTNEGPWQIVVSQQVTTPVEEAPLPGMTAPGARVLASGDFFAVERKGKGRATLYRLPDGELAIRLEDFLTSANTDLFVWASEAAKPVTSKEALESPHVELAELKSTIGNQNYRVPSGLDAAKIRSVVIWCQPVQIAYVASALRPVSAEGA